MGATQIMSVIMLVYIVLLSSCHAALLKKICSYDAIYQFGDSISDTGNLILESSAGAFSPVARLPYGETYFHDKPTGRCSDGLLMIDFIAMDLGLPLLNPYLNKNSSFRQGVNFAVAGSTALDTYSLIQRNIVSPVTNSSLLVQLDWFSTHLDSICSTKTECAQKIKRALFMLGETGGNDYNYAFIQGKSIDEVMTLVTDVVANIKYAATKLIQLGATRLVVPGNFPIGCLPVALTAFKTNNASSYDQHGCLKDLNEFALYHNQYLQTMIEQLKAEFPGVTILYADYYNAFQWVFQDSSLGFDPESIRKACCGTGGDYNFDITKMCGVGGVSACSNPDQYISWDGIHLTQMAYQYMSQWLLKHLWLKTHCTH